MTNLERWVQALVDEFDLDAEAVDIGAILDLARDAAHGVERPAAPLTTFIAGYVAGMAAGEGADHPVEDVLDRATELALAWSVSDELPVSDEPSAPDDLATPDGRPTDGVPGPDGPAGQ